MKSCAKTGTSLNLNMCFLRFSFRADNTRFYIALRRNDDASAWYWVDGSALDFMPGMLPEAGRHCMTLEEPTTDPYPWNIKSCTGTKLPYVCRIFGRSLTLLILRLLLSKTQERKDLKNNSQTLSCWYPLDSSR